MYFFQNRGKFVKNLSNSGQISMIGTEGLFSVFYKNFMFSSLVFSHLYAYNVFKTDQSVGNGKTGGEKHAVKIQCEETLYRNCRDCLGHHPWRGILKQDEYGFAAKH